MQPLVEAEADPAGRHHLEPGVGQQRFQLFGADEIVPVMRPARDHAQPLRALDQQHPRLRGAVGGRDYQQSTGRQGRSEFADKGRFVGDMLEHLETGHQIELPQIELRQFTREIADVEPGTIGVERRRLHVLGCGIHAGNFRAQPRQRFAQQPGAATDIERAYARQRLAVADIAAPVPIDPVADEAQPHRVEPVEHRRTALGVPPVGGQPAEMRRLFGADRCRAERIASRPRCCIAHARTVTARIVAYQQEVRAWHGS